MRHHPHAKATIDELHLMYQQTGSVWKTADAFGMCGQSVHERLKRHGLMNPSPDFTPEEDEIIRQWYSMSKGVRDLNLHQLAAILGREHHENVCRRAKHLGLTDINRSGTIEQRDSASIRMRQKIQQGQATRKFPGAQQEWVEYPEGKRYFLRSSWEIRYAEYLEGLRLVGAITDWLYEPETFWFLKIKRGVRSYVPDFQVTHLDGSIEYHEVKGYMDAKSKTKIKRMRIYHPSVKLLVIGKDELKALGLL